MPRTPSLSYEVLDELRRAAERIPHGQRSRFVREKADALSVNPSTIYRALEGTVRVRKRRSDAGAKRAMDEEEYLTIAAMVVRYDYDAELAIDTYNAARVNAGLPELACHPETLRRYLREDRISRRDNATDLRVHRRWEAPYPGYLMQIDSTCAHSYYIDKDNTIGYEAAVVRNKNKDGNGRPRVWLIVMVDDHTRVRWGRFYNSEDGLSWLDLMLKSWRKPADPTIWPAYGVPERVYADQGSGIRSGLLKRAMAQLEVELTHAKPSTEHETNAQAKGKVEAAVRIVQAFEKVTRWRRFDGMEEMNQALWKFLVALNRRPHSETNIAPFQRWLGNGAQVRLLPDSEITRRLSYQETTRLVRTDLTIELKGTTYQLPRRAPFIDFLKTKVPVLYLDADMSRITVVLDREEHEIAAQEAMPDAAGEFKSAPVPAGVERKRDLLSRELSIIDAAGQVVPIDPHLVLDYRVRKSETTYVGRPQEVEHPLAAAAAPTRLIRRSKVIDRLAAEKLIGTPPSAADRLVIEALICGRPEIPEVELEEFLKDRGEGHQGPRLTLVSA